MEIDFSTLTAEQRDQLHRLFDDWFPQYLSEYNFPVALITNRLIKSITFDKAQGGSLKLGGADNVNGIFYLYDALGNVIVQIDRDGIHLNNTDASEIVLIDAGGIHVKDVGGSEIVLIDPDGITIASGADIKVGGDSLNTNATIFSHLSVEHFFTGSGSYIDRTGAFFTLDGDDFDNQTVLFESVMAVEQGGRTAYCKIYNVTDAGDLAGAELTSTTVGITNPEIVRSSALTFPSGAKTYKLQIKQAAAGNGGDNSHFYAARLVITQA